MLKRPVVGLFGIRRKKATRHLPTAEVVTDTIATDSPLVAGICTRTHWFILFNFTFHGIVFWLMDKWLVSFPSSGSVYWGRLTPNCLWYKPSHWCHEDNPSNNSAYSDWQYVSERNRNRHSACDRMRVYTVCPDQLHLPSDVNGAMDTWRSLYHYSFKKPYSYTG